MISPNKAVIDDCPRLEEELNKHDIKTYVVPFKHSRTVVEDTIVLHEIYTEYQPRVRHFS